jgi:alpha-L-fucosidase
MNSIVTGLVALALSAPPADAPAPGDTAPHTTPHATPSAPASPPPQFSENPAARDARMAWWREARFGMFIHWGLYSVAEGEWQGADTPGAGEWLLTNARITPEAYRAALLPRFNPVRFDAREWAALAREAGMRYVVITTKHHDGFCLWPSALTDDTVASTPFKRDVMQELSTAVRAEGLHMGWYHSIMDWTHPDYLPRRAWDARPADGAQFERYVAFLHGQLRELLTRYGPVDVLWFDGEWEPTWTHALGARTDDLVRALQPQIIVNNRVDVGRAGMAGFSASEHARGDFGTPEQTIPANGMPGRDWETCMTMNDTWGFKRSDTNWKSARTLIRMLCDIASKGGNFLLNVGPRGDGSIPPESVERLRAMGAWLRVNGEAIYGTSAGPFPRAQPWGRATLRTAPAAHAGAATGALAPATAPVGARPKGAAAGTPTTLYLMVFEWPADGVLRVPGLAGTVLGARVLGAPADSPAPAARATDAGLEFTLPPAAPDADCSVVAVEFAGAPTVTDAPVVPRDDGTLVCGAADAATTGPLGYEERFRNLGFWTDRACAATWTARANAAGRYRVVVEYAAAPGCGGEIEVAVGERALRAPLPARGSWGDFAAVDIGTVEWPGPGAVPVRARAAAMPGEAFVNLRAITFVPVR